MDCSICVEKYNESSRKKITCKCNFESCLKCVKTYILEKSHLKPHCMSCRTIWTPEMMQTYFSKYFMSKDYRQMREKILFEEEKTFFPDLLDEAKRLLDIEKLDKSIDILYVQLDKNHKNEEQLVREQRQKEKIITEQISATKQKRVKLLYQQPSLEKKVFIMKCVKEDCKGFLSEKYKCGLCSVQICKDCHYEKEKDDEHKCNQGDVETVTELLKTTKPCPKCHIRISKIDGCDQMFCIQCHTPFSWKSGKEELGVIHNPHYFEALRNGNIKEVRHRQNQGECGPIPIFSAIDNYLYYSGVKKDILDKMYYFYQNMIHHRHMTLPLYINRDDRTQERLKYLTGKYDEKKFKQKLFVYHESSLRKKEEHEIMSSYVTIGEELFRSLSSKNVEDIHKQLTTLSQITKTTIANLQEKYKYAGFIKPKDIL